MLVVSTEVKTGFAEFLVKKGIAQKYRHGSGILHGLEGFLLKLAEKKQDATVRKEAQRAVLHYQEYLMLRKNDSKRPNNDEVTNKKVNIDKYIAEKDHNGGRSSQ
ncbi:MAG: hypothetical protein COA36_17750 [Desulfotalea sp.]|nr:MAG: hypothetical protein COA36_17750 [Desulfotalea sp.]